MARVVLDLASAFNFDFDDLSLVSLISGPNEIATHEKFTTNFSQAKNMMLVGEGLWYEDGIPIAGTVSEIHWTEPGMSLSITGLKARAGTISRAALTDGLEDDKAVIAEMLKGADIFRGGESADTFNGFAGNDSINGRRGADVLRGGKGNDILTGGSDSDQFVFDTALSSKRNVDTITDFHHNHDQIALDAKIFGEIGDNLDSTEFKDLSKGAADDDDLVLYNRKTGNLFYDDDGLGSHKAVKFAHLDHSSALDAGDFVVL